MKFITSFWKTIIWTCVVLFLSLSSGENLPHPSWLEFPHIDKVVHFIMYFVFALVLIHDSQHYSKIRLNHGQIILISVLIVIGWGGFLEILQRIPSIHRNSDFFDFLANTVGAVVASLLYRIFEPLLNKINDIIIKS
jgi:VanZ family protein